MRLVQGRWRAVVAGVLGVLFTGSASGGNFWDLDVVDATTILLLSRQDVKIEYIRPNPTATVRLAIEEVLKGHVRQALHEPFVIHVPYFKDNDDLPSIWTRIDATSRSRLLVFCRSDTDDAAAFLTREECRLFAPADQSNFALADTREVLRLEAIHASPERVLRAAETRVGKHSDVLASYVWRRVYTQARSSLDIVSRILRMIEDPRTDAGVRSFYFRAVWTAFRLSPTRPDFEAAVIRC